LSQVPAPFIRLTHIYLISFWLSPAFPTCRRITFASKFLPLPLYYSLSIQKAEITFLSMTSKAPGISTAHGPDVSLPYMGSWCDHIPNSVYMTPFELSYAPTPLLKATRVQSPGPKIEAIEYVGFEFSSSHPLPKCDYALQPDLRNTFVNPQTREKGSQDLKPMQRWLEESAKDGPWRNM
jgi:hypothetical protein